MITVRKQGSPNEHGPAGGDEVNIITSAIIYAAGRDY